MQYRQAYTSCLPQKTKIVSSAIQAMRYGYSKALSSLSPTVVGKAVTNNSVPRSEVFLTTKTFNYSKGDTVESLLPGLIESVKKMHPVKEGEQPYVDLFLIHAPSSGPEGRQTLWDAFQEVSMNSGVAFGHCGLPGLSTL